MADIGAIVARAATAWQILAGHTENKRKFLSQLGDGANSGVPEWYDLIGGTPDISGVWNFQNGFKEYSRAAKNGTFVDVPYNATNFIPDGSMTWTVSSGNQIAFSYCELGEKFLLVMFVLNGTSIGGTLTNNVNIKIPGGYSALYPVIIPCRLRDNGVERYGLLAVTAAGATTMKILPVSFATGSVLNFSASAGQTDIQGTIIIRKS